MIGCLTCPKITLVDTLIPRKNGHSDHGVRGPQKIYFKAYIILLHGPTCFVVREAKKGGLVEKHKGLW